MVKCVALVVAAGRGRRFGGETPKQYLDLGGRPVLRHSLATFATHPGVDSVRAVIHPDDRGLYDLAAEGLGLLEPVPGGASRQDSVRLGLESLDGEGVRPDLVLIHDGARPFIDRAAIGRVIAALDTVPGAIAAVPVIDTIKSAGKRAGGDSGTLVEATIDRAGLWRAQTPQGFRFTDILAAHRAAAGEELTDDAAVAERAGMSVSLVMGSEDNVKITTAADLARASRRFEGYPETRVGGGFDVHRFCPGDGVILCGVPVPHTHALSGHSDADVALHALTDALLGAVAAGDIGRHFPPSDSRWRGAPSDIFLRHAAALVRGLGGTITAVDVTLICERPRIGPHRAAMAERVAGILEIAVERVSVKATTTEGLGFTGREEGIAAQATATVALRAP
ncbi:MAG: bifunctional 2-C-methyl-D-erythritol 4-phosphate cytidylyltransferase/2-C-methyl-D-erythritol 2,4-cyclodiphosphate synthase [Alphaproteobacteria bacterium]|nr:bifunctional 2-C-methyl-D-erythritol 4-phosphate cytidylyltransferase/2-C-methyl-D-erythritol 2,4-cyclodiphosphate synthase [Alphaproteobacteria bacterium]MBF0129698.1 bifunctional 2-C-methyl-D-erythritol 4-phosphate cytidylyltransferase/2-C-methyl-D-erythritol 2,4-cyclodiphosphate synthase [Alphaproteobacteria bacterium]